MIKIGHCITSKAHSIFIVAKCWLYTKAKAIKQLVPCCVLALNVIKIPSLRRWTSDTFKGFLKPTTTFPGTQNPMGLPGEIVHNMVKFGTAEASSPYSMNIILTPQTRKSECNDCNVTYSWGIVFRQQAIKHSLGPSDFFLIFPKRKQAWREIIYDPYYTISRPTQALEDIVHRIYHLTSADITVW